MGLISSLLLALKVQQNPSVFIGDQTPGDCKAWHSHTECSLSSSVEKKLSRGFLAAAIGSDRNSSCKLLGYDDMAGWFWRGSMRSWAGLYLCYGLFVELVKHEWLNKIEQYLIPWKVMNCCRRVGKEELVNASSLALNHFVELFLSTSDFVLLF